MMLAKKLQKTQEKLEKIQERKQQILEEEQQTLQEISDLEHQIMKQTLAENGLSFEEAMNFLKEFKS